MQKIYLFLSVFSLSMFSGVSFSQDQLARDYAPIKAELTSWDPIRGAWLAESMMAISKSQPIPDRTFPEDFTPAEMLRVVPANNRQNIQNTVEANRTANKGSLNGEVWDHMSTFVQAPNCKLVKGRSHGDPHLSSFDGKSFSFQTVGEFVLAKAVAGKVEVQTRQKADGEDFSLNTAVAMNVGGDRVCIYADDKPDADFSNPVRIDGQSIRVSNTTYYLPHGGNIRNTGNKYVITWPTGENVTCEINKRSKFDFINVSTEIYPCIPGGYEGLLGNANGTPDDDINTRNNRYDYASANRFNTVFGGQSTMSNEAEKEYLHYLAKEFGHAWRVTSFTSLFDYAPGTNTDYYTDYSFPRFHRTVRDLNPDQREAARRDCENNGIRGSELDGCIFDAAYVKLPPTRTPEHKDPTRDVVLASLGNGPVRNVNPPRADEGNGSVRPAAGSVNPIKVPAGTSGATKVPSGSVGNGTKEGMQKPGPVLISKPIGEGSNVGSTKPVGKMPEPNKPSSASTVKETKPVVSEPTYKPMPEIKPARKEPVYTAPKEVKPSAPKETYSAPKPEPVKVEKTPIKVESKSQKEIKAPTKTPSPSITAPQRTLAPVKGR